ncbi:hypothetical protein jhhlp_004176 [Lomentospora prolificans]|uniref:Uncharacterized protein n=1 Tax=Lomentospora prolificans TaxID=41688 RepID=A0A2N3NAV3_9PEZI|nr:hypothetical protein jhhlp_004176 [Lomentospora prolificans]
MTALAGPRHPGPGVESLTAEDFETASIRSAAPSYVSEAPSYHSTIPINETCPPYAVAVAADSPHNLASPGHSSNRTTSASTPNAQPRRGLPPVPSTPLPMPGLSAFAIPTWSTFSANPTTRHYHSVAQRRVAAASSRIGSSAHRQLLLDRVAEEVSHETVRPSSSSMNRSLSGSGFSASESFQRSSDGRPLEDPTLVGEEAARRARAERLAREREAALVGESRRWDLYLSQMNNWQERERSWSRFRREMDSNERKGFMRRISGRLF